MSSPPVKPWPLRWAPQQIRSFWDWYTEHHALQAEYFSKSAGHSMLDEISNHIPMRGTFVDFGAGPGFVTELLLARGIKTFASDSSPKSIEVLRRRFGSHPLLVGAEVSEEGIPLSDQTANVVLLVETIEHVDQLEGHALLQEIWRVLRPGGYVAITTPHRENLAQNEVFCPHCGCVFHRMQHIRTFGVADLTAMAEQAAFRTVICRPTYFSPFHGFHRRLERIRRRFELSGNPHLLYIGQRA